MSSWLARVASALSLVILTLPVVGAGQESRELRTLIGKTLPGHVTSVVDGDTVDVRLDTGGAIRVRLEGIDAPEVGQPFFAESRNATRVALFDKRVTLRATDVDRYRRLVARVIAGGHDWSVDLVEAGLACHFTRYSSEAGLAAAQARAKKQGFGFWGTTLARPASCGDAATRLPAPAPRATTSRQPLLSSAAAVEYHGNRNSKVYHQASCRNYNCPNCVVVFHSHEDGRAAGFRPAGDCFR